MALARAQAAINAATARQEKLLKQADTDAKRLAAGDQALAHGDIRVACLVYARLASARSPDPSTETAKLKVAQLQAEAKKKLDELDKRLDSLNNSRQEDSGFYTSQGYITPSTANLPGNTDSARKPANTTHPTKREAAFDQPVNWAAIGDGDRIIAVFGDYNRLLKNYGDLPKVGSQLKAHVAKLRRQPGYAAVLNEPAARELWELGQKHERDDQLCCAYWVYKQAAEFKPALSASFARNRFDEMAEDPQIVAAAERCRELKWCHQAYLRAERVLKMKPENARAIFAEIVRRAPEDSVIYRAAKERIESIPN